MTDATDFLIRDYELKVNFLTAQFGRMWTRFNFMLVLESGLLAAAANTKDASGARAIVWAEVLISAVWYVFGAQDKHLVEIYRGEVKAAADRLWRAYSLPEAYPYTGQVDELPEELRVRMNPLQWRYKYASVTYLAAVLPIVAFVSWLVTAIVLSD